MEINEVFRDLFLSFLNYLHLNGWFNFVPSVSLSDKKKVARSHIKNKQGLAV